MSFRYPPFTDDNLKMGERLLGSNHPSFARPVRPHAHRASGTMDSTYKVTLGLVLTFFGDADSALLANMYAVVVASSSCFQSLIFSKDDVLMIVPIPTELLSIVHIACQTRSDPFRKPRCPNRRRSPVTGQRGQRGQRGQHRCLTLNVYI